MSNRISKVAYKPIGLLLGFTAGALAGMLVRQVWKVAAGDDDVPRPTDEQRGWGEVLAAAALQGAIFGVVHATADRAGATGVRRLTGRWPG